MKIEVTQQHIDNGCAYKGSGPVTENCPAAIAISERLKTEFMAAAGPITISIHRYKVVRRFDGGREIELEFPRLWSVETPDEVIDFMTAFDNRNRGGYPLATPISFELDIPAEYVEQH